MKEFIGKTLEEFKEHAEKNKIIFRIIKQDGYSYAVTDDYVPERANLSVENNLIKSIRFG